MRRGQVQRPLQKGERTSMKNEFAISEEKLSFKFRWWRWDKVELLFRNSSLLLAFLLWVEGLILFLSTVDFTLIPLVSEVKEKGVLVSLKLKALPWLVNVWQKARYQRGVHFSSHFHLFFSITKIAERPKIMSPKSWWL